MHSRIPAQDIPQIGTCRTPAEEFVLGRAGAAETSAAALCLPVWHHADDSRVRRIPLVCDVGIVPPFWYWNEIIPVVGS